MMTDAADVFVICAIDPAHRARLDATHAAVRVAGSSGRLRYARLTLRRAKDDARLFGVRLTFAKLLRRRQLVPWAEKNDARLLLSAGDEPGRMRVGDYVCSCIDVGQNQYARQRIAAAVSASLAKPKP